jgi:primosomal protein N' (replication factor Y)
VKIDYFGLGTQKVERELKTLFPEIRIARLDTDISKSYRISRTILSSFRSGEIDVLVGTQMVAKGFNFPNVTLVGVVCADTLLNLPDFRSGERTFSILTQVAGRAGRGLHEGLVIIQTYNPHHYSIRAASKQDSSAFYKEEILFRKHLLYPPFVHLIRIIFKAKEEEKVVRIGEELNSFLQKSDLIIQTLGPAPCPISRIKGEYRWQLILKVKHPTKLKTLLSNAIEEIRATKVNVDVDPITVM